MGNGNDMLEMYLFEMNTLLEQLDEIVLEAEKAGGFSQDSVNEIFRIMHTIKGSSAMMEFGSLMAVAHHIEDLFFVIREQSIDDAPPELRDDLFDMIFHSIDFFREEISKVENNEPLSENIDSFLQNINSFSHKFQPEQAPAPAQPPEQPGSPAAEQPEAPAAETHEIFASAPTPQAGNLQKFSSVAFPHGLHVLFDEDSGMENLRALMLVNAVGDFCEEDRFDFYPPDVQTNAATRDFITENGFFLRFKHVDDRKTAVSVVTGAGSVRTYELFDAAAEPKAEAVPAKAAETAREQAAAPAAAQQRAQNGHAKENLISVNLSKLDQLMAVVGEIVITESMVTASPDLQDLKLDNFTQAARQLRTLTDELQDVSMSLRMVPVSGIFQKMNRIVRDMGKKLGKQVGLTLVGENTEVDKTIVDTISDPIMHIVRNSMDHGLEDSAEVRRKAGKKAEGQITLAARHTGSEVIIEIIDDGQGVDLDAVLDKALRRGLAAPDTEYSDREILSFLLMPGFSTNSEVTEFSGRGVGMDVVKSNIESIGGTVTIDSTRGKGMTTTLKIPLTMAIMDGMKVAVSSSIFTVPINNIRQIFKVTADDIIYDAEHGEMVKCMDNFYSVIRTKEFYKMPSGCDTLEDGILLWVESEECSYCLFVDELIGEQQVVVKPLPGYVSGFGVKNSGISGCTILGDGNISIILDIANIYSAVQAG